ncbi:MAG: family 20 glycosylhydrolase [Armatimonadota bacterium]|nr:MAG: family 20 glycosylhydrolase [Armatimonadota bacterium]
MERRGVHVMFNGQRNLAALERLIGEIMPSLGMNWIIVEVNGHYQYASHPEVSEPDGIGKKEARRLAKMARDNGVNLVPMYNCLGHQSWKDKPAALLRSHPEFNEAPDVDATAKEFYCMSWCPNHPEVNPIVLDLFDELLEGFEAKAFHVGMDEVFIIGHCPRCKGTANHELFAKAVNDYHGHLAGGRGVEMMMWGDRLLDAKTMGYGLWESSENDTHQAIDKIPADIVMCDWHYEIMEEFPSVRFFQEKGFRVWPGGWNKEKSIRRFIEVARRDATDKMLGYLATTWTDMNGVVAGLAGEPTDPENERIADVVKGVQLGAELAQD